MGKSIFNDSLIAELLGHELTGEPLKDLKASLEIKNFRASLEEELAKTERNQMFDLAKALCRYNVQRVLDNKLSLDKLGYSPYGGTDAKITEQRDGYLYIDVIVELYTGRRISPELYRDGHIHNQRSRHDANYAKDVISSLRRIELKPTEEMYLELKSNRNNPRITSVAEPVKTQSGIKIYPAHLVKAVYVAQIPEATLSAIYEKNKTQLQKP